MTSPKRIPIFDGHNDVLLRLNRRAGGDPVAAFLQGEDKGHLDLPKARRGGFAGGLFASGGFRAGTFSLSVRRGEEGEDGSELFITVVCDTSFN